MAAGNQNEPLELKKVLIVDMGGEQKERETVLKALQGVPDMTIDELKGNGLSERTLLYYRSTTKDEASKVLSRTKGAIAMESMPWGGPYDLVIFLRSRPPNPQKQESAQSPIPPKKLPPPISEVIYYVTAQKYFRVVQQSATEATVSVIIEKGTDPPRCFPKVTLRALTEDRQILSEDALRAESFLTQPAGYKEELRLSFPPDERVRSLQIEIKAYDERGTIILN